MQHLQREIWVASWAVLQVQSTKLHTVWNGINKREVFLQSEVAERKQEKVWKAPLDTAAWPFCISVIQYPDSKDFALMPGRLAPLSQQVLFKKP